MPTVHSVSDITTILSGVIQDQSTLQNVWVHGKVSPPLSDPGTLPGYFKLKDANNGGESIECVIFQENAPLLAGLLVGDNVLVKGRISLHRATQSQYRFVIEAKQPLGTVPAPASVSRLIETLRNTVQEHSARVQGKISNNPVANAAGFVHLHLKNANTNEGSAAEMIVCQLPPHIVSNLSFHPRRGDTVSVDGQFGIFPPMSRYEINVTQIESNEDLCQCSGCAQCGRANQCDRLREVANFESCATCLPHRSDELYALCSQCYENSRDHETKVAEAVYAYFNELQVNGFSPYRECQIQFGSRNGFADVVLGDGNGGFAAIAECKGAGYVGHGIEQLKSYLSATDTRFGIFANRVDCSQWKFYENRRANCIPEIDLSEFEAGVVEGPDTRERLRDEIRDLNGEITGLENQKSELRAAVEQITQTEHNLSERTSDLTQQVEALKNYKPELHEGIRRKLNILLEEKIQRLEKPLSDLKIELQKRGIVNWFKNLFSKENE